MGADARESHRDLAVIAQDLNIAEDRVGCLTPGALRIGFRLAACLGEEQNRMPGGGTKPLPPPATASVLGALRDDSAPGRPAVAKNIRTSNPGELEHGAPRTMRGDQTMNTSFLGIPGLAWG